MRRLLLRPFGSRPSGANHIFAPLNDDNEQYSSGSGGDEMSDDEASAAAAEPKEEDALRAPPAGLQLTSTANRARNASHLHRSKHKSGQMRNGEVTCSTSSSSTNSSCSSRKRHQQLAKAEERLTFQASGHPKILAKQKEMYLITTLLPNAVELPLINQILPKELLLRVFSYLDIVSLCRCAQTCKFWNILALDGSNWQCVDLFSFQKDIKAPVVENLARRCGKFLKILSLRGCENVQESALRLFTQKCPNIERLSLSKCKRVTDSTCEYLGRNCHKLIWLDLENCTAISDQALASISNGCKYLEYLNISWCDNIQDRGVRCILQGCPCLNSLNLRGCEGISENFFVGLNDCCKELRYLNLHGCFVMDNTVADIASSCPNLEYLSLSSCPQITDRSLIALANNCLYLKDLELASCALLTDHGFATLAKNCHELERMDLEDCSFITDATLDSFSRGCPCLISLTLSHCELISDIGLRYLCSNSSLKDHLQVLELDNCPLITEACLSYMKQLRSLQRVDLYDCQNVSKESIKQFKSTRQGVEVHVYFTPETPAVTIRPSRSGVCRCCVLL